ncbi:hypothetical protein HYPSUDRAFT_603833 [Hypholoma sublateritium FD-334 SS-4]|uniref:Uncharacterized protein n=1 Tax=Hypholoma sublateritium (strain FD-334 SS-4) TaxID=945553 RepID=A0A0D2P384_HYPSF|nr:hypothetical protein HYPSUDRAFT_603833 [Hypholoma sublateritium FD-334 SS-4]
MDTGHYLQIPDKFTPNVQCHSEAASWAIPSDSHVGYAGISAGHHHDLHASCIDHRLALNNSISNNTQRLRVSRLPRMRPTTRSGKFREALTIALVNRRLNRCNHLLCSGTYDDELVEPTLSLPTRFDEVRNSRASRDFPTIHRRIARHRPAFTAYSTPYAKNMFTLLKGRSDIISQGQIQSALVDP